MTWGDRMKMKKLQLQQLKMAMVGNKEQ